MAMSPSEFLVWELRRRRELEGLTQEEWGERVHYSGAHVSAVERGTRPALPDYLEAVDKEFGTSLATYLREVVENEISPVWLREWNLLQDEALALRWYDPAFVPGPLQTEAYARATLRVSGLFTNEEVEQRVANRMARQAAILGTNGASGEQHLMAILDEMVLRRTVARDRGLMAEQVAHLVACAQLPNVSILVVPADTGIYCGLQGGFIIARLPEHSTAAYVDHQVSAQVVNRDAELATLQTTWDLIAAEALSKRQSLDLLKEAAETWK
ncbi:helix-turn-helix transcriptional regulator [Solwaraspora sp. WMMD1047]|uniref:helix-turn-helix domain-containing protein n=1 Tax=Solwaraspora sp. WMMD1047 TaxID=3016102 RepID=UPI0024175605|nr:helix-turn-helix transcriptional regulator [Solwaraspora sp. WMMD1047]MDG4834447.1 helix-turn-helix transcriptional regulator [Solwaraspora sp. WMMD1047]